MEEAGIREEVPETEQVADPAEVIRAEPFESWEVEQR